MSIRAYIKRTNVIYVSDNGKVYDFKPENVLTKRFENDDLEFCFNLWSQPEVLDCLMDYGASAYTNDDWVGEIEICKEDFENLYLNNRLTNKDDKESIEKINNFFNENKNNWIITFECM